jgi:hypothetical protein
VSGQPVTVLKAAYRKHTRAGGDVYQLLADIDGARDGRCPSCGYRFDHPVVRHTGRKCRWRR